MLAGGHLEGDLLEGDHKILLFPFAVVQEMPRVALGAYETVHLDYPDSWPTPGTWLNPAGPVTEPDKPFCIVVSVDAAWPNKQPNHLVSVRWTGRVDIGE